MRTWREISLAQKFPGLENITWDSFVTELINYFVPASVQNQARQNLNKLKQIGIVDQYNAESTLAIDKLQNLQHTDVPDATRQTKLYFDGLKPHVKGQMQHKLTEAHISNMTLLTCVWHLGSRTYT